jgi:protein-tyrosine phosphatase
MPASFSTHVLFVCLGNICRSPLAQGILDQILSTNGLQHTVYTDSAGTSDWHEGKAPDARTQLNAQHHGINLPYKARQIRSSDFEVFDYILVMDDENLMRVKDLQPKDQSTRAVIFKMRDFDTIEPHSDVPDPYYGGADGFEKVFQILSHSVQHFYNVKLKNL